MAVVDLRFPNEVRRSTVRREFGGGMALVLLYDAQHQAAYFFEHLCEVMVNGEQKRTSPRLLSAQHAVVWGRKFDGSEATVTPSVLCSACGTHGFITAGQWVAA